MKNHKTIYVLFLAFMLSVLGYSQGGSYTLLDKNINADNLGLVQQLNRNADTLTLQSNEQILRVSFLSHAQKETISIDVGSKTVRIPLYHFEEGRYTIAVYNGPKIVVLGFNRILPINISGQLDFDLEKSILRSSLTEAELESRGIGPFKKSRTTGLTEIEEVFPKVKAVPKRALITSKNVKKDFEVETPKLEPLKKTKEVVEESKNTNYTKIKYSITLEKGVKGTPSERETREEYRQRSLRPNGKKYD